MSAPGAVSAVIHSSQLSTVPSPPSGAWVLVTHADASACISVRRLGWEIRDTLIVADAAGVSTSVLARVPVEEPTIAVQVVAASTGVLWIDGCRIALVGDEDLDAEQRDFAGMGYGRTRLATTSVTTYKAEGRWPANLVFVHARGCRSVDRGPGRLAAWECPVGCLVPVLDVQTGGSSKFFSQVGPGGEAVWMQRLVGGAS